MKLFEIGDGADAQARAVLAYLSYGDGIECSWSDGEYKARPTVARWENCREQGYVVSLKSEDRNRQLNVAFFEHRNSDNICAVMWEQVTLNSPTIDTAEFGNVYKDKHDVSKGVPYGEAEKLASWVLKQLADFWERTSK